MSNSSYLPTDECLPAPMYHPMNAPFCSQFIKPALLLCPVLMSLLCCCACLVILSFPHVPLLPFLMHSN
jgi:hypothetical protein